VRRAKPTDICRACGKAGRWARECWSKGKKLAQAHVAEEEQGGLLFTEVCDIQKIPTQLTTTALERRAAVHLSGAAAAPKGRTIAHPSATVGATVHLVEEKVYAQIGKKEEAVDHTLWVVNTGATNHMTGAHDAFTELDTGVWGTVRFGDGSVVRIEGCGTVVFSSKGREH
jgi:hypothetical protein